MRILRWLKAHARVAIVGCLVVALVGSGLYFILRPSGNAYAAYPTIGTTNHNTDGVPTALNSHTVNLPSGIVSGDLIIVYFCYSTSVNGGWTSAAPSGWTNYLWHDVKASDSYMYADCFYRVANGSEGSTITVTTSTPSTSQSITYRISTGTYTGVPQAATFGGTTKYPDPPNLAPSWGSQPVLWLASAECHGGTLPITAYPSNYTNGMAYNNGDASSGGSIGTAQRTTTASSENPGTFTRASTDDWVAGTVGIEGVSVVVPSVTTGASAPSSITISGATCNEQVTATGGASVTAWGTYYGLTASYGSHKDNSGTQASPFSWSDALTSLAAGTLYHYQAYGTNSAGTGTGSDAALLTLPGAPTGLTDGGETVSAVAVTWTNAAVGSGTTVYTMIRYRTDAYPTSYTDGSLGVDWTTGTSGTISGLSAATLYYVAAFSKAVNGALTQYSTASVTLLTLTLPAAPTSLSSTPGNAQVAFTWTSASGGAGTTISTQIQYRTDAYPTAYNDGSTGVAWTTGTSGMASSLTNGTLYYFGAFSKAVNGGQTRYSTASAQTTSTPFTVPTVVTGSATSVKGKEATCGGQVTATGGATITAWGTQFGLTTGYGSTFPNSGTHATAFTWTDGLTSLVPNTLYHFRSYATNPAGTSYGGDGTFTTTLWGGIVSFDGASISTLTVILTPPSSESKTAVTTVDGMNANN